MDFDFNRLTLQPPRNRNQCGQSFRPFQQTLPSAASASTAKTTQRKPPDTGPGPGTPARAG